ncbi:uncharacterized protein GGS22DRAFT_148661 [Annulohypoxylon maeteangense]|uniref:uncharacterized protein n=1 Tax=Annulohypoxylon maeteangense TaxID=1927788 RepID=UPI00200815A6|nr:uncharacterized protein GGS22DRAFT_148661 [Annulohypoxylon maeteangense]KAI0889587.1 hypothetical protein GGS22DRAFT_148661 [Annulohypoxylon maeteangense]
MEKLLPSYLQRSDVDAASDPNLNSWLFKIPLEILWEISSFLPQKSAVCFTLTCKLALHTLGTSSWKYKSIVETEMRLPPRWRLMRLLTHDIREPGFAACRACMILHRQYPFLARPSEYRKFKFKLYCPSQRPVMEFLPLDDAGFGYNFAWEHLLHGMKSSPVDSDSPIEYLSGSFRVPHPYLKYTVSSSARRVRGRDRDRTRGSLVIRHDHCISLSSPERPLRPDDILRIPLRICPHHNPPANKLIMKNAAEYATLNSPIFTHSIVSAFPVTQRTKAHKSGVFRKPSAEELERMTFIDNNNNLLFQCRSCHTKWRAQYTGDKGNGQDELTVSAFHPFAVGSSLSVRYFRLWERHFGNYGE